MNPRRFKKLTTPFSLLVSHLLSLQDVVTVVV